MKKKLLWISPYAPFDTIDHAGGKTHNYYIKYFKKNSDFDITLLSLCFEKKSQLLNLNEQGINNEIYIMKDNLIHTFIRYIVNFESEFNPFNKYAGALSNYQYNKLILLIKKYAIRRESPDIIIMQWAQVMLLTPLIEKVFPNSKLIAIEEDVLFLAYERKIQYVHNLFLKRIAKYRYKKIYKLELEMLSKSKYVIVNNKKDADLLKNNGFDTEKILTIAPYFDDYTNVNRHSNTKFIIYYGAMGRKENYLSAIWFIRNVLPLLKDTNISFLIIGGGANKKLKKYQCNRIKILGFVEDLKEYFSDCLCLVAPLVLGAGIKVKIIEAFSAGIPVLTNNIGIEGIEAEDGQEYLHCETPKQYADKIIALLNGNIDEKVLSKNARIFIRENFDVDKKLDTLIDKINLL